VKVAVFLRSAILGIALTLGLPGAATAACPPRSPGTDIAVGIRLAVPMIEFDRRGEPHGLAIDIWSLVERELREVGQFGPTEFIVCPSIRDQGEALASGALDVVISPLTITAERMRSYAFSQQYLSSGLTVATRDSGAIDFRFATGIIIDTVTQPGVVRAILGFLVLNLVVALLLRWALRAEGQDIEREKGPVGAAIEYMIEAVSRTLGLKGVGDGFRGAAGKMLEIFMAVVGTALSATIFGVLTSAFVGAIGEQSALPAEEVVTRRVATLANSTAQDFLQDVDRQVNGPRDAPLCAEQAQAVPETRCILTPTWGDAVAMLAAGEVDLVLGDWVALSYLARSDRYSGRLTVQAQTYVGEAYGWGITPGRPDLRNAIDRSLVDEMRQPGWRRRIEGTLGTGAISPE
jgi:ABC-type amino acid transport substrate-binding protein